MRRRQATRHATQPPSRAALACALAVAHLAACETTVDAPPPAPPGVVIDGCDALVPEAVPVLPRTSTHEFRAFVSDLLGEPVAAETFAAWTPLAKVWGFDTMTEARIDAQTFDAQWETTDDLARALAASARVATFCPAPAPQTPVCTQHATYDPIAQFSDVQGNDCWFYLDGEGVQLSYVAANARWEGRALVWSNGLHPGTTVDVIRRWTAPVDGTVGIQATFTDADPGGGDGVNVVIRRAGAELFRASIGNGGAAVVVGGVVDDVFADGIPVLRGETVDFVVERGGSDIYDTTGFSAALSFTPTPSSEGLTWESCAAPALVDVASRAFRRPLRPEELTGLQEVFDETLTAATEARVPGAFQEALTAALQAVLLSPHVHYKPELVPGGFDASEESYRRAARLALYFTSSFPDDQLMSLAGQGRLTSDDEIRAQAERLLQAGTARFVDDFAGQWLDFRGPLAGAPESTLQLAMRDEAHAVFQAVLLDGLPPESLIEPGFTVVNDELAAHYGLPLPGTVTPVRVETIERGGLFTQGHFLTSTARGTDFRRVIHRGLYTLTRALCRSVPLLDPATREEIDSSVGQIDPTLPLGEQMQLHRESSGRCINCHGQMDPLGLALERYDENGLLREQYPDGSAIFNDFDFNGVPMGDPDELATYMKESGDFELCVAEKLLTFGLHRAPRGEEYCVIEGLSTSESLQEMAVDAFVTSLKLTDSSGTEEQR